MEKLQVYKDQEGLLTCTRSEYPVEDAERVDFQSWELDQIKHSTRQEIDMILFNKLIGQH